jgi:hypothetical protein
MVALVGRVAVFGVFYAAAAVAVADDSSLLILEVLVATAVAVLAGLKDLEALPE